MAGKVSSGPQNNVKFGSQSSEPANYTGSYTAE